MLRASVFQELQDDGRLVKRLVVILKCRYRASRTEFQEALRLMVWVHFGILVWGIFFFEDYPNTLNYGRLKQLSSWRILEQTKRSKPACIKLHRLWFALSVYEYLG